MSLLPSSLPNALQRTVVIRAKPAIVFRYFTDSTRWASWWGAGSTIDPRPGGAVLIRYPGGVEVSGEVIEINPPTRIAFTYGFVSGAPIPPGSSRIVIELEPHPAGTRLQLRHEFTEAHSIARDEHVQGWRYQLSVFANVVSDEVNSGAADVVDSWFDAWAESDANKREQTMARVASPDILFNDRYSNLETLPDLLAHMTAAQRFMPGIRMRRTGNVRHCQGMVLADWIATDTTGIEKMRGTNVFVFGPAGLLESVTGFATASTG